MGTDKGTADTVELTTEEKMRLAMDLAWKYGGDFFTLDGGGLGFLMACENDTDECDGWWTLSTGVWDSSLDSLDDAQAKYGGDWAKGTNFDDCSCREYTWYESCDRDDDMKSMARRDKMPRRQRKYTKELAAVFEEALERKRRGLPAVPAEAE